MKDIIIIGTGAVAAELTSYIEDNNRAFSNKNKVNIVGYIDYKDNIEKYWRKYKFSVPVICDIDEYSPIKDEQVIIGVSNIKFRNKLIKKLKYKKATFASFIHHSTIIPKSARIGVGNIIYPNCIIGPNTTLGDFNIITSYSFISHDCMIGNGNFFSTAGIAGRVTILDNNFFGIRSTVIPSIEIGSNNIIQAGMVVDKNINDNTTIFYRFREKIIAIPKS